QARRDLQQLSARLLQIQEDERTRLSRELHDEIGQTLTALRLAISRALSWLRTQPPAAEASLEEARLLAEKTLETVRNISVLLRPSLLDDLGLEPALQWQAEDFSRRSGIRCGFFSDSLDENLPAAHRTCVYRVVQEALTNCAKHSAATHVDIHVRQAEGELKLEVADNGKGFPMDAQRAAGLGILGMRERAAALGGQLLLESAPGEGTRVSIRLPVAGAAAQGGEI
ncbi:MAG: sensor histidine kinase, partial [Acidobacteria bacterium]|nr:sensor histidine kinase [Acidobacteriota bacterium]